MRMPKQQQIESIDQIYARDWSDYGTNYLLTAVIGVNRIQERQELVRTALAATLPQYAKSRVAAAWACLSLGLRDQTMLLDEIEKTSQWMPLKWSCHQVLQHLT